MNPKAGFETRHSEIDFEFYSQPVVFDKYKDVVVDQKCEESSDSMEDENISDHSPSDNKILAGIQGQGSDPPQRSSDEQYLTIDNKRYKITDMIEALPQEEVSSSSFGEGEEELD